MATAARSELRALTPSPAGRESQRPAMTTGNPATAPTSSVRIAHSGTPNASNAMSAAWIATHAPTTYNVA